MGRTGPTPVTMARITLRFVEVMNAAPPDLRDELIALTNARLAPAGLLLLEPAQGGIRGSKT